VDDDGKAQRLPWEDWRDGEDQHTSGWVRATSPAGDPDFDGVIGWSGDLGFGVRPGEGTQSQRDESAPSRSSAGVRLVTRAEGFTEHTHRSNVDPRLGRADHDTPAAPATIEAALDQDHGGDPGAQSFGPRDVNSSTSGDEGSASDEEQSSEPPGERDQEESK
jgi:hypothetical protein